MEKLIFGSLEFSFTPEGELRIERNAISGWAMSVAVNRQQELIDFLIDGYKANMHKGAQSSSSIEQVWQKIENMVNAAGGFINKVRMPSDEIIADSIMETPTEAAELDFRLTALKTAKEELEKGNYATAAKLIEMYETL